MVTIKVNSGDADGQTLIFSFHGVKFIKLKVFFWEEPLPLDLMKNHQYSSFFIFFYQLCPFLFILFLFSCKGF